MNLTQKGTTLSRMESMSSDYQPKILQKNMKNNVLKILCWIGAVTWMVAACSDDKEEPKPARQEVVIEGEILTLGSDKTAQWKGGEEVGIYMVKAGTNEIVDNYANVKHIAEIRDNKLYFVPADKVPMYFPEDGSAVSFRAYYPYFEGVKTRTWVEKKEKHSALLILDGSLSIPCVTKENTAVNSVQTVKLKLTPILGALTFEMETSAAISSVNMQMNGVYTKAEFNFLTGELVPATIGQLPVQSNLYTQGSRTVIKAGSLVIPSAINDNANLEISLKDNQNQVVAQGTVSLNEMLETKENEEIKENTLYNVAIQVTENGEIKTQLKGTSPLLILNWTEDKEEEEGTAKPE